MELHPDHSPERVLHATWQELRRATTDRRHPFRLFQLATSAAEGPLIRTVVLRALPEPWQFRIFTDVRSQKVAHLTVQSTASLHFYHPKRQVQVVVQAEANVHHGDALATEAWSSVSPHTVKDYNSAAAPGSPLDWEAASHALREDPDGTHFAVIDFTAVGAEVLQLRRAGHLRYRMTGSPADWEVERIVP